MERVLSSNKETESIYEIYRACRLCGGGAGYKMPIIQNIVDLDESDVELKQKIRDCVQIEVHQDDKMPPLICELCVDKVNDFYEFLDMCRQTNTRTRLRLGLPPQSLPKGAPDAGDCILGVTEPLFANEDSDGEPLSKHKKSSKVKIKKEPVKSQNLKEEHRKLRHRHSDEQELSGHKKIIHGQRITRNRSKDDDVSLSCLKDKANTLKNAPKSILKKDSSKADNSMSLKRLRDKEISKSETQAKKVKLSTLPKRLSPKLQQKTSPRLKPQPRSLKSTDNLPKRSVSPTQEIYPCDICGFTCKTVQARTSHWKSHTVGFTNSKLACNPCGDWFPTPEDLATHQKRHKSRNIPYNCRICNTDFKKMSDYESHFKNNQCISCEEIPDIKCEVCWHLFPTSYLLDKHKCLGEENRPGGKCKKCNKSYSLLRNLRKHESSCTCKKKGYYNISKELLSKLKPLQVRVARCDPLLTNVKREHYDVSCVSDEYGLDENCYYPYISGSGFRTSNFKGMVNINDDIKKAFCAEDYVHWDSDESDSDQEITCSDALNPENKKRKVPSLAAIALKKLFSNRLLGKVPKKKRKIKPEKVFDSILNDQDEVRMDINSLIDNLGDDDDIYNDNNDSNLGENNRDLRKNCFDDDDDTDVNSNNDNDRINDRVINNCFNDKDHDKKRDDVSSIDDTTDFNINNDNGIKDNSSVDSIDLLQDLKNNINETDNNTEINDTCDNDRVDKDGSESLCRLETESTDSNTKINDNHSIDSKLSNNNSNNDSELISNNDSIDTAVLEDEIDKRINETSNGINNDVNDSSSNDKVINEIDKLLNNGTEKVSSYCSINDYSFDT